MSLVKELRHVNDNRGFQGRRYNLSSILSLVIAARLCGHVGLAAAYRFGKRLSKSQKVRLGFGRLTTPSHPILTETFRYMDIESLEHILGGVVSSCGGNLVALDGKTLCGSYDGENKAVHLVSAFCNTFHGVLDQVRSSSGGGEIAAAVRLVGDLDLNGLIITGDAQFCQKEIVEEIINNGGDYMFTVKENQKDLYLKMEASFESEMLNQASGEKNL